MTHWFPLGPVERVNGFCTDNIRPNDSSSLNWDRIIKVDVPTMWQAFGFCSALWDDCASFDIWGAQIPRIEIYGSMGTLVYGSQYSEDCVYPAVHSNE
jgi:hypothetical protein